MGSKVRREEERKPSHRKRGRGACACVRVCARNNSGASAGPTRLSLIITLFLSIALPFLPPSAILYFLRTWRLQGGRSGLLHLSYA